MEMLQGEKCAMDGEQNSARKFQYVSVITRAPRTVHTVVATETRLPIELADEEVVIVAEYNEKKVDIPLKTEIAQDLSSVVGEKENRKRKRRRKKEENNNGLSDDQFCYVECGPEVIDLDDSDTDSASSEHSEAVELMEVDDEEEEEEKEEEEKEEEEEEETFIERPQLSRRFEVLEETSYHVPGEKIWKHEMGVRICQPCGPMDSDEWWEKAFEAIFAHLTSSCDATDNAAITFTVANSVHVPIILSCRSIRDFSHEDMSNLVGRANSGCSAAFKMDDTFLITMCVVRGAISRELLSASSHLAVNRSILTIRSDDQLSLPRSLVVARVYAERGEVRSGDLQKRWERIRYSTGGNQLTEARNLVKRVGVKIPKNGWSIRDLETFQNYLARDGVAIIVYEKFTLGRGGCPVYNGTALVRDAIGRVRHTYHLAYYERSRHYQPILNLPTAARGRGFCAPCNTRYNNEVDHNCLHRCAQCFGSPPCDFGGIDKLQCDICKRCFFGESCFARHKMIQPRLRSICATIQLCGKCWGVIKTGEKKKHDCDTTIICK